MKQSSSFNRVLGLLLAAALTLATSLFGQGITSSAVSGFVTNKQGAPAAGATVTALHEPTGTVATTTVRATGQYNLSGLRPGGPYTVTVTAAGQAPVVKKDVFLELGDALPYNVSLGGDVVVLEKFTVAGERDLTFGAGKIEIGRAHV